MGATQVSEGQGFYQGNDYIWLPKHKKVAHTNRSNQDKPPPQASKKTKMVWVRKTSSPTKQTCPSPPTNVPRKRAEPQEPTWRRVVPKPAPQKIEPQEPALVDKTIPRMEFSTRRGACYASNIVHSFVFHSI